VLLWTLTYRDKPKFRKIGIVQIIFLIVREIRGRIIVKGKMGDLDQIVETVREKVENFGGLKEYGYSFLKEETEERFQKFLEWLKLKVKVDKEGDKTLEYFGQLLYLEEKITLDENRKYVRKLQRSIKYRTRQVGYKNPWVNEKLTDEIITAFIDYKNFNPDNESNSESFRSVTTGEGVHGIKYDSTIEGILDKIKDRVNIDESEILRLKEELEFKAEEITKLGFLERYLEIASESNSEVKKQLKEWLENEIDSEQKELSEDLGRESSVPNVLLEVLRKRVKYVKTEHIEGLRELGYSEFQIMMTGVIEKYIEMESNPDEEIKREIDKLTNPEELNFERPEKDEEAEIEDHEEKHEELKSTKNTSETGKKLEGKEIRSEIDRIINPERMKSERSEDDDEKLKERVDQL